MTRNWGDLFPAGSASTQTRPPSSTGTVLRIPDAAAPLRSGATIRTGNSSAPPSVRFFTRMLPSRFLPASSAVTRMRTSVRTVPRFCDRPIQSGASTSKSKVSGKPKSPAAPPAPFPISSHFTLLPEKTSSFPSFQRLRIIRPFTKPSGCPARFAAHAPAPADSPAASPAASSSPVHFCMRIFSGSGGVQPGSIAARGGGKPSGSRMPSHFPCAIRLL